MNECILAACITLFSGVNDNYGASVEYSNLYMKLENYKEVATLTQGIVVSDEYVNFKIGFGSVIGEQIEEYGLNFVEGSLRAGKDVYIEGKFMNGEVGLGLGIQKKF